MLKIGKRRNPLGSLSSFSSRHRFDGGAEVYVTRPRACFRELYTRCSCAMDKKAIGPPRFLGPN